MKERGNSHDLVSYPLTIDYSRSLKDRIAAGHYCHVDKFFTKNTLHFPPTKGEGKKEVSVIPLRFYPRGVTVQKVIEVMHNNDLKPAGLDELLAFGEAYSDYYQWIGANPRPPSMDVVALGSLFEPDGTMPPYDDWNPYYWIFPDQKLAPYIKGRISVATGGYPRLRGLDVRPLGFGWDNGFRFLAVQK
jgi:hypothetical protein